MVVTAVVGLVGVVATAAWCVAVVSGQGHPDPVPVYRLPTTVVPTQYKLTLQTDPKGFTFSGQVTIDVVAKAETDNITLHSNNLTINWVKLSETKETDEIPKTISSFTLLPKLDVLYIQPETGLQALDHYRIEISFGGYLTKLQKRQPGGYLRVATGDTEATDWMTSTAFEMVAARKAFPCWDEPHFKARFHVSLIHQNTHKALSNMPLVNSVPAEKEGWIISHFENTPMMSTYLVTFQLLQWDHIETKADDGRPLRLWASPKDLPSAHDHLDFARKALAWLQNYTGVPEPMPKIDLVAVPGFPGAIENWGDITFGLGELMHQDPREPVDEEMATIAHELVHSWFGNLVSPHWWDSLWLSEGAATFFSALAVEELIPGHLHLRNRVRVFQKLTYYMNAREIGEPLSRSYDHMDDLLVMPRNVYYHGFSLFYMLYQSLGHEHFKRGIHRYLSGLQYDDTTPRKLYDALDYQWEGKQLHELMDEWTYQGGFPVVTVTRSGGKLTLKQERFLLGEKEDQSDNEKEHLKWWIPISFTNQSEKDFLETRPKLWFKDTTTVPDPAKSDEWLILNNMAAGLYIVQYDKTTLELIKKSLKTPNKDGIPDTMREKIYFDFEVLVTRGTVDANEIWEMHELLAHEKAEGPWTIVTTFMRNVRARLHGTSAGDMLTGQMQRLLMAKGVLGGDRDVLQSRVGRSACLFDLLDCTSSSYKIFNKWAIEFEPDKVNPIPSELKPVVYCSAMRAPAPRYWHFLLDRALHAEDSAHRDVMFSGLGCTQNYKLLYKLLANQRKAPTMTERDWAQLLGGLARHNGEVGHALKFIQKALQTLKFKTNIKLRLSSHVLRDLAAQIVQPAQLPQLSDIINLSENTKSLTELTQMVQRQVQWKKLNSHI